LYFDELGNASDRRLLIFNGITLIPLTSPSPFRMLIFPRQDVMHQIARIDVLVGQRPAEPFRGGELSGGSAATRRSPQLHESPDGPSAATQSLDTRPGVILGTGRFGQQFRPVCYPLNQHSSLDIAQPASQCFIPQNASKKRIT
jgi:hypothetical protein